MQKWHARRESRADYTSSPQQLTRTRHDQAAAADRTVLILGANGRFGLAAA